MIRQLQRSRVLSFFAGTVLMLLTFPAVSQTTVLYQDFTGYAGTVSTIPNGWDISWNSTSPASYYTSAGNFGASAPSYKFGNDGDYIVTELFSGGDTVSFWVKGNGSPFSSENVLTVSETPDNVNWMIVAAIDSLPISGTTISLPISVSTNRLRFQYMKFPAGGNLGFDDVRVTSSTPVGDQDLSITRNVIIYPTPTTGMLNLKFNYAPGLVLEVEVFDMIGNPLLNLKIEKRNPSHYLLDLSGKQPGYYFIRLKTPGFYTTRRISITAQLPASVERVPS